jgi:hypothetical protein
MCSGFDMEFTNRILAVSGGFGHSISGSASLGTAFLKHPNTNEENRSNNIIAVADRCIFRAVKECLLFIVILSSSGCFAACS